MAGDRRTRGRAVIRELTSAEDPAFKPAHALLRKEFERDEMVPLGDWRYALRELRADVWTDLGWHLLVAESGSTVLSVATGLYLGNVNVGVVGYVAVAPSARRLGLGPRMRRTLIRRFEADARHAGRHGLEAIVGEVRADNPWLSSLVRREGAIALDVPYFQPAYGPKHRAVPLVLYYQPLERRRLVLGAAQVRRLLYTVWRRGYRVARPLEHAAFRRMLRALEGRRVIGQHPAVRELEAPHPRRSTAR